MIDRKETELLPQVLLCEYVYVWVETVFASVLGLRIIEEDFMYEFGSIGSGPVKSDVYF